jgi:hypothetical protein
MITIRKEHKTMPNHRNRQSFRLLNKHPQDQVLQEYIRRAGLKPEGEEALHMFFSPNRIPIGLTNTEVHTCIALYPLRKAHVSRRTNPPELAAIPDLFTRLCVMARLCAAIPSLPLELSPHKRMTRWRFRKGIAKFRKQACA